MSESDQDVERYGCTRCSSDIFHAVVSDGNLSFLRCVTCERVVFPENRSMSSDPDNEIDKPD